MKMGLVSNQEVAFEEFMVFPQSSKLVVFGQRLQIVGWKHIKVVSLEQEEKRDFHKKDNRKKSHVCKDSKRRRRRTGEGVETS